jgi:prepilin-type N-terminal cleavage/methylation domain-containing protein
MKQAFTMLELVIVIVVIGILAATVAPTFQRDTNAEAAQQFLSHVRYTQHLAMVEDKFDPTDATWFRDRWQIRLASNGAYAIFSDANDDGAPDDDEVATDPLNREKRLAGDLISADLISENLNLVDEYGVSIALSSACGGYPLTIAFDHLGRPLLGDISADTSSYPNGRLLSQPCVLTFSGGSEDDVNVTITPETGYTFMN